MDDRALLRHALAVIAYRGGKCIRGAPDSFASFAGAGGRTPLQILAHLSDLFDWALTIAKGDERWHNGKPTDWSGDAARFHRSLEALDQLLASSAPIGGEIPRLLQGPFADALTHVGQLAMMRRMAGAPIRGENYYVADIVAGRVGADQAAPVQPFG